MAFPLLIKSGSVVVRIYRAKAPSTEDGWSYVVSWIGPRGRERATRASLPAAKDFAANQAERLARGLVESGQATEADMAELFEARHRAEEMGLPLLGALDLLKSARKLVGSDLLPCCESWVARKTEKVERLTVDKAVDDFLAEKQAFGRKKRTYEAKLRYAREEYGALMLDVVTVKQWAALLAQFKDPVTRNDIRKRVVALCRWAQKRRHLPRGVLPAIEETERSREEAKPPGILTPAQFAEVLRIVGDEKPELLSGVVLAGFCGLRADEVQGKRENREQRQLWKDVYLERAFLSVSAAKTNTPSWRVVPLCEAALAWLRLVPLSERRDAVSPVRCLERVRWHLRHRKERVDLPENCLRHSWISYRLAVEGNKAQVAEWAGNSPAEITRRYRVPLPKEEGEKWFALRPSGA